MNSGVEKGLWLQNVCTRVSGYGYQQVTKQGSNSISEASVMNSAVVSCFLASCFLLLFFTGGQEVEPIYRIYQFVTSIWQQQTTQQARITA
jgi:hypothetical protein